MLRINLENNFFEYRVNFYIKVAMSFLTTLTSGFSGFSWEKQSIEADN